jgi:hypothetical protein
LFDSLSTLIFLSNKSDSALCGVASESG